MNKNTSSRVITHPNIIRPERNSNLKCNSSRYSQILNIKSIYQRTSRKSPDNLKFEQKYKFKGHSSAKKSFDRKAIRTYTVTHLDIATYQISSQYIKGRQRKVRITSHLNKKYKFKSHNSAKNQSTGTKFELKL